MEAHGLPKWQQEVEAILREQYEGPELERQIKTADELMELCQQVEIPSGNTGKVAALILKLASEELPPLQAVYAGFHLGVAYERYQNANRA